MSASSIMETEIIISGAIKTRGVIDASNEIVVPAFIDANVRFCFHLPSWR